MERKVEVKSSVGFKLPLSLVGRADVLRIIREVEALEDQSTQNNLRGVAVRINFSPSLSTLVAENGLDMTKVAERDQLKTKLKEIRDHAPIVQVSFAVEPPANVVGKILLWLRREIDTSILMSVGIQPGIAAGCVVKTANKYFDFSLRQHLVAHSDLLVEKLRGLE